MYDDVAKLQAVSTAATYDTCGNQMLTYTPKPVFVHPRGVYSSEFYQAAQAGLHPSITFELTNRADYNGEKLIEWNGKLYDIVRADWTAQRDRISLVCEERIGNG